MNKFHDITVTIPTLNEEKNIAGCISSIKKSGVKNIIIIDGGSKDKTITIIKKFNVKIILTNNKGLAYQRMLGVKASKTTYTALIDADMRTTKTSFLKMKVDLSNSNYAGVEAFIKPFSKPENYFDKSYQEIMNININKVGTRRMIGTPTLWRTKILKKNNFDKFFTGPSDDTDLCYRIFKKGYKFGGSNAIVKHVHRDSALGYLKKYFWYGKGDAQFVKKHPERLLSIIKHQLFNYPIKFSIISISRFNFFPIPFMVISGLIRFIGMINESFRIFFNKKDKIYKT